MNPPVAVTIAGTDSGGAAGVAADLTTFAALGVHGACVVTAVTAQDTTGVREVHAVPADVVAAQLDAVTEDLPVAAIKTGMLGTDAVVREVTERVVQLSEAHGPRSGARPVLVVDPVLVATSGAVLADEQVLAAYRDALLPVATVVTPNLAEARTLVGHDGSPEELAAELTRFGCAAVVTGGPDGGDHEGCCTDWVALPTDWGDLPAHGAGRSPRPVTHAAVDTANDHGTGCTYSAALAAHLAHGEDLAYAARAAAAYTTGQLDHGQHWTLGRGRGPVAHTHTRTQTPTTDTGVRTR